jgi:hypothetical protein
VICWLERSTWIGSGLAVTFTMNGVLPPVAGASCKPHADRREDVLFGSDYRVSAGFG